MRTTRFVGLIILVLLAELVLSALFSFRAVNLAKYPYRRAERYAAFEKLRNDNSPDNEAAYRQELLLVDRHLTHRQLGRAGVVFLLFLGLDAVVVYAWNRGRRKMRLEQEVLHITFRGK